MDGIKEGKSKKNLEDGDFSHAQPGTVAHQTTSSAKVNSTIYSVITSY